MLGKEEDIMCNLSSPIHIYLIVTQYEEKKKKRYLFDSIYEESQKIKTKLILIIDYTSKRSCFFFFRRQTEFSDKLLFRVIN
jgi:hypothetical protein